MTILQKLLSGEVSAEEAEEHTSVHRARLPVDFPVSKKEFLLFCRKYGMPAPFDFNWEGISVEQDVEHPHFLHSQNVVESIFQSNSLTRCILIPSDNIKHEMSVKLNSWKPDGIKIVQWGSTVPVVCDFYREEFEDARRQAIRFVDIKKHYEG